MPMKIRRSFWTSGCGQLSRRRFLTVTSVAVSRRTFGRCRTASSRRRRKSGKISEVRGSGHALDQNGFIPASPEQMADRIAFANYSMRMPLADRRDVVGQMSLFTADTEFLLFNG